MRKNERKLLIPAAAVAMGLLLLLVFAGPLAAQQSCAPAADVTKLLKQKYDEEPVAFGLQSNGNLLQVYSSAANGTWTIVSTTPAGMSCIVAAGKLWESLPVVSTDPLA